MKVQVQAVVVRNKDTQGIDDMKKLFEKIKAKLNMRSVVRCASSNLNKMNKSIEIKHFSLIDYNILLEKVNRVEVIDQNGRSYVNWKPTNKTEINLQDDGKTLKVFISKRSKI